MRIANPIVLLVSSALLAALTTLAARGQCVEITSQSRTVSAVANPISICSNAPDPDSDSVSSTASGQFTESAVAQLGGPGPGCADCRSSGSASQNSLITGNSIQASGTVVASADTTLNCLPGGNGSAQSDLVVNFNVVTPTTFQLSGNWATNNCGNPFAGNGFASLVGPNGTLFDKFLTVNESDCIAGHDDPTASGVLEPGSYTFTLSMRASAPAFDIGGNTSTTFDVLLDLEVDPCSTQITATPGNQVCPGTTVTLDAGSGYDSYSWEPGGETTQMIQVTTPGTYRVTTLSNSTEDTDTIGVSFGGPAPSQPVVLVSSKESDSVVAYDATTGEFLYSFVPPMTNGLDYPNGITTDSAGHVYVASVGAQRVMKFAAFSGDLILDYTGTLDSPVGVLVSDPNTLLVANYGDDSVHKFDLVTGQSLGQLVTTGAGGLNGPADMLQLPTGELLVASQVGDQVLAYDSETGAFNHVAAQSGGLDTPAGLLLDPLGNLLVASLGTDQVLRFDPSTGGLLDIFVEDDAGTPGTDESGGLDGPEGLAWSANGNLLVSNRFGANVLEYDGATGAFLRVLSSGGLDEPTYLTLAQINPDCNNNGLPDSCDISGQVSSDCNNNQIPDDCDIASGTSSDCNNDEAPDECELAQGSQHDKLAASDGEFDDQYGQGLAVDGTSGVVGAPFGQTSGAINSGSAYFIRQIDGIWQELQEVAADDAAETDRFGLDVAISGNTAVIGAYSDDDDGTDSGSAYVFQNTNGAWEQVAKLTASDAAASDHFGISVGISGDTIIVGASDTDQDGSASGSVYVFEKINGDWQEVTKLTASDGEAGHRFGRFLTISGDTVLVGAYHGDANGIEDTGAAYVFRKSEGTWQEMAKLTASDAAFDDNFGFSVALEGGMIVVGSIKDWNGSLSDAGSAYVFQEMAGVWHQVARLTADDATVDANFARAVAIRGDQIIVGSRIDGGGGAGSGAVYVFSRDGLSWIQSAKSGANDAGPGDFLGDRLAIGGTSILAAAARHDGPGADSGAVYLFDLFPGDCNENHILDECDIAGGSSTDDDDNGIPDECEVFISDCNANSIPDEQEPDFDGDGFIDDCDLDDDNDTVADADDVCDFTPIQAISAGRVILDAQSSLHGTIRGDYDGDCDCDLTDYAIFLTEFTGPTN